LFARPPEKVTGGLYNAGGSISALGPPGCFRSDRHPWISVIFGRGSV